MKARAFIVVVALYMTIQGMTLLYTQAVVDCIPVHELVMWLGTREFTGAILVFSLPIATFAVYAPMQLIWRLLLLFPQVVITFIYAVGAAKAIYLSSYADGILRSREFILDDQLPLFLILYFHTVSVLTATLYRDRT